MLGKVKMAIYIMLQKEDLPGKRGRTGKGKRADSTFEAALLGTENQFV